MKKLMAAAVLACACAPVVAVHAAPTGCNTRPMPQQNADPSHDQTCEYVATGAGEYLAATPNHWTLTVSYKTSDGKEHVRYYDDAAAQTPTEGPKQLPSERGDRVVIVHGSDCVHGLPSQSCGQMGTIAAYELHL